MWAVFDGLREFTPLSLLIRLCVALVFGGMIGLNGTRKQRAAGFRTYMLVCMGAALTMLISQYFFIMLQTQWKDLADEMNLTTDVSRFSAQVINGIGFLGAGTVLLTGRQEVKGVTTAAGLWASACMGLAIGAGFIECFIVGFIFIIISLWVMPSWEAKLIELSRNVNLFIEFHTIQNLSEVISEIKSYDINIYDIDIERPKDDPLSRPNAVVMLHLNKRIQHTKLISDLSRIKGVYSIKEI